jgi:hypothetical protein
MNFPLSTTQWPILSYNGHQYLLPREAAPLPRPRGADRRLPCLPEPTNGGGGSFGNGGRKLYLPMPIGGWLLVPWRSKFRPGPGNGRYESPWPLREG